VASDTRCALVVVAVALFGLLSMHGWGSHAGMHPAGMTTDGAHPMVAQAPHRLAAHDAEGQAAADAGYRAGAVGDEEPSGGDLGLLGLCLAVLGGLLRTRAAAASAWWLDRPHSVALVVGHRLPGTGP
jgi:hypothetical protein